MTAQTTLERWTLRASSEFSAQRATLAMHNEKPVGVFITLSGKEIPACRRADLFALVSQTRGECRSLLQRKLEELAHLTAPVAPQDYYIRTIVIDETERGHGYGRQVVDRVLQDARDAGYSRIRLDVDADNLAALHLYRSFGFKIIAEGAAPKFGLRMYSMLHVANE